MPDGNSRAPGGPAESRTFAHDEMISEASMGDNGRGAGAEPGSVHVIVHSDRTRIVLSGEVDADLAADLSEATSDAEATGHPIEIDAQHVTFMDSSGIAFLARIATRSSHPVRIINAPETVRFLLEVTRIGELLEVVEDTAVVQPHGLPTIGPEGRHPVRPDGPDDVA